ncbi:helix-turn-helix domain-containing protein [Streptomyces sp. NPDC001985]|uniref:helix-turn-helix domain-containing protein n=1 Tax=Streptomyces sp. NPDC001985 TaxID=3154406 RepID=UPI0033317E9C
MTAETDGPDPTRSLLAFFGCELCRIRTEVGMSQGKLARAAHTTQSMISKIEAAKRVPSEELATDLDAALGTGGHFGRLYPLVIHHAYPSWFLPYIELEPDATSVRSFENLVMPGLLQTEEYARAIVSTGDAVDAEDLVAARISRQRLFEREVPPRLWFIMEEYVLLRHVGGRAIMQAQLQRLLEAGRESRTVIQVIPRSVPVHAALAGAFQILGFEEDPDVLYVDGFSQGRIALDAAEVDAAARAYDLLRAVALSPEASAELIGAHLEGLKQ